MSKFLTLLSSGGFIMTSRPIAKIVGLNASALLGDLCTRQAQHGPDFWATNEQLQDSTTLSERGLRNASNALVKAGFISVEKKGLPAKNHYTVNEDALVELFSGEVERGDVNPAECGDKSSRNVGDQSSRNVGDQSLQNVATTGYETPSHIKNESNNELITTNKNDIVRKQTSARPLGPSRPWNSKESEKVAEVVQTLNEETGAHYRPTSKATMRHILARLREGFTVDDCKEVIRKKTDEWGGDPEMSKYLRPETLFGSKFESYLNAPEDPKKKAEAEARKRLHEKYAKWDDEIEMVEEW